MAIGVAIVQAISFLSRPERITKSRNAAAPTFADESTVRVACFFNMHESSFVALPF